MSSNSNDGHDKDFPLFSPSVKPIPPPQSGTKLVDNYLHDLDEIINKRKLLLSGLQKSVGGTKSLHKRKIRKTEVSQHMDTTSDEEFGRRLLASSENEDAPAESETEAKYANQAEATYLVEKVAKTLDFSGALADSHTGSTQTDQNHAEGNTSSNVVEGEMEDQGKCETNDEMCNNTFSGSETKELLHLLRVTEAKNEMLRQEIIDMEKQLQLCVDEHSERHHHLSIELCRLEAVKEELEEELIITKEELLFVRAQLQNKSSRISELEFDLLNLKRENDDASTPKNMNHLEDVQSHTDAGYPEHLNSVQHHPQPNIRGIATREEAASELLSSSSSHGSDDEDAEVLPFDPEQKNVAEQVAIVVNDSPGDVGGAATHDASGMGSSFLSHASAVDMFSSPKKPSIDAPKQRSFEDYGMSHYTPETPQSSNHNHRGQEQSDHSEFNDSLPMHNDGAGDDPEDLLLLSSSAEGYKEAVTDNIMLAQYLEESNAQRTALHQKLLELEQYAVEVEKRAEEAELKVVEQSTQLEWMQNEAPIRFDQELKKRVQIIQQKFQEQFNAMKQNLQQSKPGSKEEIYVVPPPPSFARGSLMGPACRVPREGYAGFLIMTAVSQLVIWVLLLAVATLYLALLERQSAAPTDFSRQHYNFDFDPCNNSNVFSSLFYKFAGALMQLLNISTTHTSFDDEFCSAGDWFHGKADSAGFLFQRHDPYRITS